MRVILVSVVVDALVLADVGWCACRSSSFLGRLGTGVRSNSKERRAVKPVSLHRQAMVALRHSGCFVQSEKVVSCPIPCSPDFMFVAPPANKGE